ncbi:MAG: hypothetical protein UR26_C0005G0013 [candidate division TM6 bacterium GW2011_GWF2_32_72]|nr:MAG: hypothetical protein UR26_C0005G0013 [candidate division TM6 bacterium GW2011_GWF2_32_72]
MENTSRHCWWKITFWFFSSFAAIHQGLMLFNFDLLTTSLFMTTLNFLVNPILIIFLFSGCFSMFMLIKYIWCGCKGDTCTH